MLEVLQMRDTIETLLKPALHADNVHLIANDDDLSTYGRAGKRCQVLLGLNSVIGQTPAQANSLSSGRFVAQQVTITFDFGLYGTKLWDEYTGLYAVAKTIVDSLNGRSLIENQAGPLYFSNLVPIGHNTKDRTWEYLLQMQVQYKTSSSPALDSLIPNT